MAKSGRCASMSETIASRIRQQLQPCATPQRPPSLKSDTESMKFNPRLFHLNVVNYQQISLSLDD